MKIFCDTDGTIINSIKRITDLYTEDFHLYKEFIPIHWTEINTWEMSELSLANRNIILDYFSDFRFFDKKLEFMDNALEVLTELNKEHEIIICTLGTQQNLKYKQEWFEKHLPFAKFIGIDLDKYEDKSHIDMSGSIYVDDLTKCLRTSNALYKLTFSGNEYEFNTPSYYPVVSNWTDVKRFIEGL